MNSPRLFIVGLSLLIVFLAPSEASTIQPVLVERCAEVDPSVDPTSKASIQKALKDSPQITQALGKEKRQLLRHLLAAGANPNVCSLVSSVLSVSVASGDLEEVRLLLDNGAHPDKPLDAGGSTPLFSALSFAHYDIAKLLLSRGANARHIADGGLTALHEFAVGSRAEDSKVRKQQAAVAQQLTSLGLSVDAGDARGTTPLMLAVVAENLDLITYLLGKGANANTRNKRGQSALDFAKRKQRNDIVKLLQEYGAKQ